MSVGFSPYPWGLWQSHDEAWYAGDRSLSPCLILIEWALALLLSLLSVSSVWGQETTSDSTRHRSYQVGVSASSLVKLLEEGDPTSRYQLYGRYWTTDRRMIRADLRYQQLVGDASEIDVGLRGGVARVFRIDERWRFYGGGDLIGGYQRFANGNVSHRFGLSPVFGAIFFASPNVSLSVEPRLVALYTRTEEHAGGEATSGSFEIQIDGVSFLILSIHF